MIKTKPPPPGTHDVDVHERRLTELADKLQAKAEKLLETDVRIHIATGKELALASIRARKEAAELALARADRAHDEMIIAECRRIDAGAAPRARPRLRSIR